MQPAPRKNPDVNRKMIIRQAEKLLRDEGQEKLGVDLRALAERNGIVVQAMPDHGPGVSGMLMYSGNTFGILYGTHVDNDGFQRFSIGHELGHYFLEGHCDALFPPGETMHQSRAGFASANPFEREADYFASGLLMPSGPFEAALKRIDEGLDAVIGLAGQCGSSLTATGIRYADLTKAPVAVILSQSGQIAFAMLSEAMKGLPDIRWPKRDGPVPKGGLTAALNADTVRVLRGDRDGDRVDLSDWLGGRSVYGTEEVIGLGRYGYSLTVLTANAIADPTYGRDEDDEETLIESWTPRFR